MFTTATSGGIQDLEAVYLERSGSQLIYDLYANQQVSKRSNISAIVGDLPDVDFSAEQLTRIADVGQIVSATQGASDNLKNATSILKTQHDISSSSGINLDELKDAIEIEAAIDNGLANQEIRIDLSTEWDHLGAEASAAAKAAAKEAARESANDYKNYRLNKVIVDSAKGLNGFIDTEVIANLGDQAAPHLLLLI